MQSTRSRGEPTLPFDPELNRRLHRINNQQNLTNLVGGITYQPPPPLDAPNQVVVVNLVDDALRRQRPVPRLKSSIGETLISLILMGLLSYLLYRRVTQQFPSRIDDLEEMSADNRIWKQRLVDFGLPYEDPHAHIAKLRSVCNSCVGRLDLYMNAIGLKVFHLSLTEIP
ncbi:hypothetical protein EJD97_010064 [Solanum chilense]|uniref:Uncharacterized protein n=1 Tax=Solanum chilense TaxID=4083 RepID=A0A6N2BLU0_SOLCI|nr:hypothetical protein EJD97_010064 [Solanum chilense]